MSGSQPKEGSSQLQEPFTQVVPQPKQAWMEKTGSSSSVGGNDGSPNGDGKSKTKRLLLNLISDIKLKLANLDLSDSPISRKNREAGAASSSDLPLTQFIICGGQSSGKSRLVESLAGAHFNFVSGTLGSRRPTVVEFRTDKTLDKAKWHLLRKYVNLYGNVSEKTTGPDKDWVQVPLLRDLQSIVAKSHESLGLDVSEEPIYVRLESPHCVDMQVVDLPGFREFSDNPEKQILADKIENMVLRFMKNPQNIILCVEPSGDAANLKTLSRCKKVDNKFERTVLIRTKLDKYYPDLNRNNISLWWNGYGDLPETMQKFGCTLPNTEEALKDDISFLKCREEKNAEDINHCCRNLGLKQDLQKYCGFNKMAASLETIIEKQFSNDIRSILELLEWKLENEYYVSLATYKRELQNTGDAWNFTKTIRTTGATYARALCEILHGSLHSDVNRMTLADELIEFERFCKIEGLTPQIFDVIPCDDFADLNEYIDYLGAEGKCPGFSAEINGGAQFTRLLYEIEIYFRFCDIQHNLTEREVVQARGVGTTEIGWMDSIVKLMRLHAPARTRRAVEYTAARLKWYFSLQKDAVLKFMLTIKKTSDSHLYSRLLYEKAQMMEDNPTLKRLIYKKYDSTVAEHQKRFHQLLVATIDSMLQKPSALMKGSSMPALSGEEEFEGLVIPTREDTIMRIRRELADRGNLDLYLKKLIAAIPETELAGVEAVERVTSILVRTFAFVRSFIADEIELFAVSFFQLPMLRRLEQAMQDIRLDEDSQREAEARRIDLSAKIASMESKIATVEECVKNIKTFRRCCI